MITLLEAVEPKKFLKTMGTIYGAGLAGGLIGGTAGGLYGLHSMGNDVVDHINSLPEQDRADFIQNKLSSPHELPSLDNPEKLSFVDKLTLGDSLMRGIKKEYPYTSVVTRPEDLSRLGSQLGFLSGIGAGIYGAHKLNQKQNSKK